MAQSARVLFDVLHQETVKLLLDGLLPSFTSPSFTASITHNINEMTFLRSLSTWGWRSYHCPLHS